MVFLAAAGAGSCSGASSLRGTSPPFSLVVAYLPTLSLQLATISVPLLNPVFKTQPLSLEELAITLALSSVVFIAVETGKLLKRHRETAVTS
jgi:Ca2+-transporting ATPase